MTEPENEVENKNSSVSIAFQALVAEYNAMRAASLSRDQIIGNLDNFMLVVLSAAMVSLNEVLNRQLYVVFPLFSLVLCGIALARRHEAQLLYNLARYEEEVLRINLLRLMERSGGFEQLPPGVAQKLWGWQPYRQQRDAQGSAVRNAMRRLIDAGLTPLFLIAAVGFLALFVGLRGLANMTLVELGFFVLASFYCGVLTLTYLSAMRRIARQMLK